MKKQQQIIEKIPKIQNSWIHKLSNSNIMELDVL